MTTGVRGGGEVQACQAGFVAWTKPGDMVRCTRWHTKCEVIPCTAALRVRTCVRSLRLVGRVCATHGGTAASAWPRLLRPPPWSLRTSAGRGRLAASDAREREPQFCNPAGRPVAPCVRAESESPIARADRKMNLQPQHAYKLVSMLSSKAHARAEAGVCGRVCGLHGGAVAHEGGTAGRRFPLPCGRWLDSLYHDART